jgi:hypothetical protein
MTTTILAVSRVFDRPPDGVIIARARTLRMFFDTSGERIGQYCGAEGKKSRAYH